MFNFLCHKFQLPQGWAVSKVSGLCQLLRRNTTQLWKYFPDTPNSIRPGFLPLRVDSRVSTVLHSSLYLSTPLYRMTLLLRPPKRLPSPLHSDLSRDLLGQQSTAEATVDQARPEEALCFGSLLQTPLSHHVDTPRPACWRLRACDPGTPLTPITRAQSRPTPRSHPLVNWQLSSHT